MNEYEEFEALIRDLYGRMAWTHKTHEKQADEYYKKSVMLTWAKIIVSAIAAFTGFFSVASKDGWGLVSSIVSVVLLLINLIFENRNYTKLSEEHNAAASLLWDLRESYLALLFDVRSKNINMEELRKRRDELQRNYARISSALPRTGSKAYQKATDSLHQSELTFSDEEIDHILPIMLRKGE